MGRKANTAVAARWRKLVARWRRSGQSIAEFCRREGVHGPSFYAWRRRLSPQRAGSARRVGRAAGHPKRRPRFVQLPAASWPGLEGTRIALPGGAIVTLPPQATVELVTTVIRAAMIAPAEDRPC